jgi:hypothetical protein
VTRSFFEFRSTCPASGATTGKQTVHRARHLFRQHSQATLAPMSHLRIAGGIHQPSGEQSPGSGPAERGQRGTAGQGHTIGISAPFTNPTPADAGGNTAPDVPEVVREDPFNERSCREKTKSKPNANAT